MPHLPEHIHSYQGDPPDDCGGHAMRCWTCRHVLRSSLFAATLPKFSAKDATLALTQALLCLATILNCGQPDPFHKELRAFTS